jgi:hypothetical protein
MNTRIESLHMLERACWQELARAAADRQHDWRVMTLATVDGQNADARCVVLREADPGARELLVYTDHRSPKVAQLARNPQAMLCAWSAQLSWQLRLRVVAEVLDSGLEVSSRWARLKLSPSAQDYLSPLAPGTPVTHFAPQRGTRDHFALLRLQVQQMDWLELHEDGHRRAAFDAQGARWLVP